MPKQADPVKLEVVMLGQAMTGQQLGACEWFVWDLRRSDLLDRNLVDKVALDFLSKHPEAEPPHLAEYLVSQGLLTQFQAESLLNGRANMLVVGPYVLHEPVGTGSMGTVYRARSRKQPEQWFAVKILPRRSMWNIRMAKRQVREFESFSHPSVVPFADIGTSGGLHYLVWPFVEGETLDKLVARDGKLEPSRAVAYIVQAAEGLAVCHERGLIHALVKPSNLLRTPHDQICVLDFGVGSLLMENEGESVVDTMSSANALHNNLDCASPESIADPNQVGPASDQYSLGCVLYYLLSGRYPFGGETAIEKMMAHQTQKPTPLRQHVPEVPETLEAVVQRMLAKSPAERFPSLLHAIQALAPFLQGPAALHTTWNRGGRSVPTIGKGFPAAQQTLGNAQTTKKPTPLPSHTLADALARRTPIPSSDFVQVPQKPVRNGPATPEHLRFPSEAPSSAWSSERSAQAGSGSAHPVGAGTTAISVSSPLKSAGYWNGDVPTSSPDSAPQSPQNYRAHPPRPLLTPISPLPGASQSEDSNSPWALVILAVVCGVLAWYLSQLFL